MIQALRDESRASSFGPQPLVVQNLSKSFTGKAGTVVALDDVSLQANPGETLVLLGPNGSGKTTLIKMMSGLLSPDSGRITICGSNPLPTQVSCLLGGGINLYQRLTVQENIEYFASLRKINLQNARPKIRSLLERFKISDKRDSRSSALSRGMQQKVALIACLICEPQVLVLDEPTLGLDIDACDELLAMISEIENDGVSVLFATHQLDLAEKVAARVAILFKGRLLRQAPLAELLSEHVAGRLILRTVVEPSQNFCRHIVALGATRTGLGEFTLPHEEDLDAGKFLQGLPMSLVKSIERDAIGLEAAFRAAMKEALDV